MAYKVIEREPGTNKVGIIGLSTETKPTTFDAGSEFQELDGNQDFYMFDGTSWIKML